MTPFSTLSALLLLLLLLLLTAATSSDYTALVFKGCATQTFQDPTQNLKTLLDSLAAQSASQNFYATNSASISGLIQCRGDLTNSQCYTCVNRAQKSATKLCKSAIAARIQLVGCYLKYQVAGFNDASGTDLLYKVCGSSRVATSGFDGVRKGALGMVISGVQSGNLFYTGSYESFYVLGQCEGDLSAGDCVRCINEATTSVENACGDASFGQVYLNRCYVSYSYYGGKVPKISAESSDSLGSKDHAQRTVAIVVGGVAALGFLVAFLLCLRSFFKRRRNKRDDW